MGDRRRALLVVSVAAVALAAGCSDNGAARRDADVTISVAYDGHHNATVTVHSVKSLPTGVATRVVRETEQRVLGDRGRLRVTQTNANTVQAELASVPLHGTVRVDARQVVDDARRIAGLRRGQTVWLGVCIPQTRAKWTVARNGSATDDYGCNAWYAGNAAAMYLHLGDRFNATLVPICVLFVLAFGAALAYPLFREYGHGTLIGVLSVVGFALALIDAFALAVLHSPPILSDGPKAVFGMDPDATLHRLQAISAYVALAVALGFFLIALAIGLAELGARARRRIDAHTVTA